MTRKDLICWLDLETTGIDPCADRILEVGMILTDFDLNEVAEFSRVIKPVDLDLARMSPIVSAMHNANGLLQDVHARGVGTREAHADAVEWLAQHTEKGSAPSAGFSVGFDRSFLAVHCWALHEYLSHRSIDCSTLKILKRAWRPGIAEPQGRGSHRVLDDCREAMTFLRAMRAPLLGA